MNKIKKTSLFILTTSLVLVLSFTLSLSCDQGIDVTAEEVLTPVITPASGPYNAPQSVSITCATGDVEIRYTTDGNVPTTSSNLYSNEFNCSSDTQIRARAFKASYAPSPVASASYRFPWITTLMDGRPNGKYDFACVISGELVYFAGGSSGGTPTDAVYTLDLSSGAWTVKTSMPAARMQAVAAISGTYIYVIGGYDSSVTATNTTYRYNILTDTWDTRTVMPTARAGSGIAISGTKIYILGGAASSFSAKLECYDISLNSWSTLTDIPLARQYPNCCTDGTTIFIAGGYNSSQANAVLIDVYAYTIASNTWTPSPPNVNAISSLPDRRVWSGGVWHNSALYVIGGINSMLGASLNTTYNFNPTLNTWASGMQMSAGQSGISALSASNRIVIVGGDKILYYYPEKE